MEGTPKNTEDYLPKTDQLVQLSLRLRGNGDKQNLVDIVSALGRKIKNMPNIPIEEKRKIYHEEIMKLLKEAKPNDIMHNKEEGAEQPTGSKRKKSKRSKKSKKSKKSKRSKKTKKTKRSKRSKKK